MPVRDSVYLTRGKYETYRKQLEYMEGRGSAKLAELFGCVAGQWHGAPYGFACA